MTSFTFNFQLQQQEQEVKVIYVAVRLVYDIISVLGGFEERLSEMVVKSSIVSQCLLLLLLSLQFMSLGVEANVFLDFELDPPDSNVVFLVCYNEGERDPHPEARFEFTDPITGRVQGIFSTQEDNRYRFDVTPDTEATIRCFIDLAGGRSFSLPLNIAGERHLSE